MSAWITPYTQQSSIDYAATYRAARGLYRSYKRMPYLRGTKMTARPYNSAAPTLQNQINLLKSKVSANKPEVKYFNYAATTLNQQTGVSQYITSLAPTAQLIADLGFRDLINGSKWTNLFFKMNILKSPDCDIMRVIVYYPKRPANTINFGANFLAFSKIPDASQYVVLADRTIHSQYGVQNKFSTINVPLRRLQTTIVDNGTTIEKGDIKIYIVCNNKATSAKDMAFISWRLTFHDNP